MTQVETDARTNGSLDSADAVDRRFRKLIAYSTDFISIIDEHGNLRYANPVAEDIFNRSGIDFLDHPAIELVHPEDRQRAATALLRDLAEPGAHPAGTYRLRVGEDEWRLFEVRATNLLDDESIRGVVLQGRDVTEAVAQSRALRMLSQVNRALVHATDERRLLQQVCTTIVDTGGYLAARAGYLQHGPDHQVLELARAGAGLREGESPTGGPDELVAKAIRSRVPQVGDVDEPDEVAAAASTVARRCVLPLVVANGVVGALEVGSHDPEALRPADVALLTELADSIAYGIGRIRDAALLTVSEERYRSLASSSPIGILEVTGDAEVTYANPRACEIAGVEAAALLGRGWFDVVHPEDLEGLAGQIDEVADDQLSFTVRFRVVRPDREIRHVLMSAAAKDRGDDSDWVVTVIDESEEVHAHEELAHQALYDALTDLPNRALFLVRLRQELSWSERENAHIAVLFMDLDLFKLVNDSLGHDAGDCVLREVARRFSATIRSSETAARLGGDEFMFIIRDVRRVEDAIAAATRLLDSLKEPVRYGDQSLQVTGSIGIVVPGRGADADTVLRDADTAMYQAKSAGRNCYEVFDEELHLRSVTRLERESDLRAAVVRGEFVLHYQPTLDPRSGRPVGAEALVRWQHPQHGLVPPLEFIGVAEESGLIAPIGRWVLEEAVAQMARWDAEPGGPHLEHLSINFSARQLDDVEGVARIGAVLKEHGVDPSRIEIEITESVAMADRRTTKDSLESFEELGIRVSIDDFGTGYSSLAYLHTLPVSTVKIDRSFIERLADSGGSAPVVSAILDLGHAMGLRVVAEGVSSPQVRELVAEMGCDLAQGYYWSPPLSADEFGAWWRGWWHTSDGAASAPALAAAQAR